MKKYFLILLPVILFSCQDKQMTVKEKTDDFLFLYETLKDNYPYFDLVKRTYGVDWLAKKDEFAGKIQSTPNDTAYIFALWEILDELNDGHTDIFPTVYPDFFLDTYNELSVKNPEYKTWIKYLEKSYSKTQYWSGILASGEEDDDEEFEQVNDIISNYSDTIIANKGIAIMNIPSFISELINQDSLKISRFLENLDGIETLIINIQGNGGGSTNYWRDLIVSRMISDTIKLPQYFAIKNGALNKDYYSKYFDLSYEVGIADPFYDKIPAYFSNDASYFLVKEIETITPVNPIGFDGSIYLLVDGSVFSSAEGFAYFSQITGWAVVAGKSTAGDGIGSDPIIICLPKSGIKVRVPVTAGFNADGSLNSEKGTTPDHIIEGKTRAERLKNLINLIN